MKSAPIGIFDSGIGGLTVAKAIRKILPQESLLYYGDTKHLPYGDKSKEAIIEYSLRITDFLLEQNCKAILIACNSASSAAYQHVQERVNGKALVFNVIDPVVRFVIENFDSHKIGLIGTKRTIQSNIYATKLREQGSQVDVRSLATPLLAHLIEEGFYNNKISHEVIEEYLSDDKLKNIEALILGCTHYPLIKTEIEQFYEGKVNILDSASIVAERLHYVLKKKDLLSDNKISKDKFYVSDYTRSFEESTKMFFGKQIHLEQI